MREGTINKPWLRVIAVCAVLGLFAAAVAGAGEGVSDWRHADTRFAAQRSYLAVRDGALLERQQLRSANASAFVGTASDEARRLSDALAVAPKAQRRAVEAAQGMHERVVAMVSRALVRGASPPSRAQQLTEARRLLATLDGRIAALSTDRQLVGMTQWPHTIAERGEAGALALAAALGAWLLLQLALRACGVRRPSKQLGELERLHDVARTDSLTSLGNHRAFHDDLTREIKRRNRLGSLFSLLAIDLDGLKQVNDERGHLAGDEYIKRIAQCLRDQVGDAGAIYRTGGDEFMVLLPNRRAWHALTLAHNIQRSATAAAGRRALSVGVTESTHTESSRLLIHQADLALYEAKRHRLLAVTYHPGLDPAASPASGAEWPTQHQKTLAAALARAVDAKDSGTRNHCETVAELCVTIGARFGIENEQLERLRLAGLLHDVGKIGVPDAILQKPAALMAEERVELEQHVAIGHAILMAADLRTEAEWVLHHHERFDGSGYPARLAGDQISRASRIIAVADAFEAMTGGRPYRDGQTTEQALAELRRHAGTQFDPGCVAALCELFAKDEPDTLENVEPDLPPAVVASA
jgi:diguanylate cyclase (GGDEF)-like protein